MGGYPQSDNSSNGFLFITDSSGQNFQLQYSFPVAVDGGYPKIWRWLYTMENYMAPPVLAERAAQVPCLSMPLQRLFIKPFIKVSDMKNETKNKTLVPATQSRLRNMRNMLITKGRGFSNNSF